MVEFGIPTEMITEVSSGKRHSMDTNFPASRRACLEDRLFLAEMSANKDMAGISMPLGTVVKAHNKEEILERRNVIDHMGLLCLFGHSRKSIVAGFLFRKYGFLVDMWKKEMWRQEWRLIAMARIPKERCSRDGPDGIAHQVWTSDLSKTLALEIQKLMFGLWKITN